VPKNEDGEFELILANRQLLSVFFIVVVLLGVFFTMGYIVGRNSGPMQTAEVPRSTDPGKPIVVEHPAVAGQQPDANAAGPPPSDTAQKPSASGPPPTETKPVETQPAASAPPPKPAEQPKPKPPEPASHASPTDPPPGDYWQVVATPRPDAELVAETLAKKGFKALVAPAPKEGFFRVLVGPFSDSASLAQARSGLEAAGFKTPMVRKY
jgi:cell division septation protein DedD